jgi:hypothetical protein
VPDEKSQTAIYLSFFWQTADPRKRTHMCVKTHYNY